MTDPTIRSFNEIRDKDARSFAIVGLMLFVAIFMVFFGVLWLISQVTL